MVRKYAWYDGGYLCPVCTFTKKTSAWQLSECKHTFCADCLRKWANRNGDAPTCPLCRKQFARPAKPREYIDLTQRVVISLL